MTSTAEKPKRSLLARIISLEGAMAAFGIYSLYSGLQGGETLQIFWGVMILGGLCLLIAVRRRDWKKHWAEVEAETAARLRPTPPEHDDTTRTEK
jgi:hypothetical protein